MIDKDRKIDIMGIVNLTDDSFFSDSRCSDVSAALRRIEEMVGDGADIIDIGACSTRPGAEILGVDEEWSRLEPVLKEVGRLFPEVSFSIDTYWSDVVRRTFEIIGPFIVNDVSASEMDPYMLDVVGKLGLDYVAMHMRGNPKTMQEMTEYVSVTEEVADYFTEFSRKAYLKGVKRWILDPGFGFAKTQEQNYTILRELKTLRDVRCGDGTIPRILVGVSRKSMIYKKFGITPHESLPATQVLHLAALQNGADMLRVHDVSECRRTVDLYRVL